MKKFGGNFKRTSCESEFKRILCQQRIFDMAQAASKVKGFTGLVRSGIQRYSGEIFSSPRLFGSCHISQLNPKSSSCSALRGGASFVEKLGHVNNSFGVQYVSVAIVAKAVRGVRSNSFSYLGGVRNLATKELMSGYRSASARGLQRLGMESSIQHQILSSHATVKHEVNSVTWRAFQGQRRYHVDKSGMQHFKRRGPASWSEKFATQQSMGMILVLVGGGLVVYTTNRQTIPYIHRKHFMLVSPRLERSIGDGSFEMIMKEYRGRILPPNHPQSLRVHKISDQIIEAVMLGVGGSEWNKPHNRNLDIIDISKEWDRDPHETPSERPLLEPHGSHTHTHDDTVDDTWVDKSRQEGLQKGQEGYTKHLEGMEWKVMVVDDEIVNAICIPGGKIVVFTGLLKKFRSDAEVATVVAHEVGHAVARHSAEALTNNLFIVALQLIVLSVFYVPGLVSSVSELLLRLPFSRRMEIEADHIGLILMAAAGYDPRLAPGFYEKLGELEKVPEYAQYMSTHPSGKKRGELLRNTATMDEALRLYQQKMSGQGTEGFF